MGMMTSISQYNSLSVSCLAFILQLISPKKEEIDAERKILSRLTASPRNSLPTALLFDMKRIGTPNQFRSIVALATASQFRVAHRTCTVWKECIDGMRRAKLRDQVLLQYFGNDKVIEYDYEPFALLLARAADFSHFPEHARNLLTKALAENRDAADDSLQKTVYHIFLETQTKFNAELFFTKGLRRFANTENMTNDQRLPIIDCSQGITAHSKIVALHLFQYSENIEQRLVDY